MSFLSLFSDENESSLQHGSISDLSAFSISAFDGQNGSTNEATTSANSFSCRYMVFGCTKQLPEAAVGDHEKSCDYKIYECVLAGCDWQGGIAALRVHIINVHANIVLTNGAFKVPTTDLQMICIIFAYDETFLVQIRCEALKFFLSVKYVGKPTASGKFLYNVVIKNNKSKQQKSLSIYSGKMKHYLNYSSLMEKTDIEFDIKSLDRTFNAQDVECFITISKKSAKNEKKPTLKENETKNAESKTKKKETTVTKAENDKKKEKADKKDANKNKNAKASTEKVQTPTKEQKANKKSATPVVKMEMLAKEQRTKPERQESILRELECPVCQDYMYPPIMLCISGHSICSNCKSKVVNCPICTSEFGNTRNYTLEKMLNLMQLPCRNGENGCRFTGNLVAIEEHKSNCKYEHIDCPMFGDCKWNGTIDLLRPHLDESHKAETFIQLDEDIYYDLDVPGNKYNFIKFKDELYRVSLKPGKQPHGSIYWSFQKISKVSSARDYKIEITFLDQTNNGRRFIINDVFHGLTDKNTMFNDVLAIPYT
ncbi:hypothetical protein AMK59_7660, partial [Oryctes borbonicus]